MRTRMATGRAIWLRFYRHSLTRFAAFGLLGLAFDVSLLWLILRVTTIGPGVAVTMAFFATYCVNFALNRVFTFEAHGSVVRQLARFAPQVCLDYLLTLTSVDLLGRLGLAVIPARILAGATNAAVNYLLYRFWTFRPRR